MTTGPVTVVGLGLMGGSLVRGLAGLRPTAGWSPLDVERSEAAAVPGVRAPTGLGEALDGAAAVVLAVPLGAIPGVLARVVEAAPGAWITDVGSLQAPPLAWAREAGVEDRYVTSHPMTGGEDSGFAASRADLYRGVPVWLSRSEGCDPGVAAAAGEFWAALGARTEGIDPGVHDRRMAAVSHLPQVVATHLAALLADRGVAPGELGPGGRDTTRLSGSDPRMWRDILSLAGPGVADGLRALARRLDDEAGRMSAGEAASFGALLERTRAWRRG